MCLFAGISKVAEPYKIGERTIDVMLEILNLDKKEVVSIDGISNQEFSEVPKYTSSIHIFHFYFFFLHFYLFKGSCAVYKTEIFHV